MTAPLLVTAGVILGWLTYFWAAPRVDRWRARRRKRRIFGPLVTSDARVRALLSSTGKTWREIEGMSPTALTTLGRDIGRRSVEDYYATEMTKLSTKEDTL